MCAKVSRWKGKEVICVDPMLELEAGVQGDILQVDLVGKEHLVLDLSCRKKGDHYYVVTDRCSSPFSPFFSSPSNHVAIKYLIPVL